MAMWLCPNCEGQVTPEDEGLVYAKCFAFHHPLGDLCVFRAQGIPLTQRIAIASPEDVNISRDKARVEVRLNELDSLDTFGPELVIWMRIVDFPNLDPVKFVVQEFTPQEGDNLFKSYDGANGEKKQVKTAPFCIANIRQYRNDFYQYIVANVPKLASSMGEGFKGIVDLSKSDQVTDKYLKEFYTGFSYFIFCALLKTSSGYLEGPEYLGTEPIDEPGHRLHGKRICPRMLIAQTDPLETIEWLAPSQRDVMVLLTHLLESKDIKDWAPVMAILTALNQMVAFTIKDRIRHGKENFEEPFTIPEYVNGAVLALMVLITKFHKMEASVSYTREEALNASPSIYQFIYARTNVTNYKMSRDFSDSAWWNGQLLDSNPDWVPYPPIMPGDKPAEPPTAASQPTFEGLIFKPIELDSGALIWC